MAVHKFPKQEQPKLDLIMNQLVEKFGGYSLEIHDLIVKIMESENVSLQDERVRKMLALMAIKLTEKMSHYDF